MGVLGYAFWQKTFQGRDDAIGRTLLLDGTPMTIVGVMTPEFDIYPAEIDMWVPLPLDPTLARNQRTLRAVGRLAPARRWPRRTRKSRRWRRHRRGSIPTRT